MQGRGSGSRPLHRAPISFVMIAMFATMASFYVAGRLWQDAQNRVYLIKELDRRTGQGQSSISVDDTLKLVDCRHQHKRLAALGMELAAARHDGFVGHYSSETNGTYSRKKLLLVIGVTTGFERKHHRDAVRKSWLPIGEAMKKMELEKGVVARFVIGRSPNQGDSFDREIDDENRQTKNFIILDNHVEAPEEQSKKTKLFLVHAADTWDAEFYAKINDDVYVNIDALGAMLATHMDKPRVYIGCMKSGEVFSESSHKWFEPEWWKFGDGKSSLICIYLCTAAGRLVSLSKPGMLTLKHSMNNHPDNQPILTEPRNLCIALYFRHASGEMFVITRAIAQFISINRSLLRTYAHDDVSVGSWMIGLAVKHVNEGKLCCSSWSSGAICAAL